MLYTEVCGATITSEEQLQFQQKINCSRGGVSRRNKDPNTEGDSSAVCLQFERINRSNVAMLLEGTDGAGSADEEDDDEDDDEEEDLNANPNTNPNPNPTFIESRFTSRADYDAWLAAAPLAVLLRRARTEAAGTVADDDENENVYTHTAPTVADLTQQLASIKDQLLALIEAEGKSAKNKRKRLKQKQAALANRIANWVSHDTAIDDSAVDGSTDTTGSDATSIGTPSGEGRNLQMQAPASATI